MSTESKLEDDTFFYTLYYRTELHHRRCRVLAEPHVKYVIGVILCPQSGTLFAQFVYGYFIFASRIWDIRAG